MVNASVGFQCPECVAAANQDRREWRTTFGGRVSEDPGRVSKIILIACVVMYVGQLALGDDFTARLWLVGLQQDPDGGIGGVAAGDWYRLLTAAFLHGSLWHIAFNMYALWLFGPMLEGAFGRARFVVLYVLAALGGSAASYAFGSATGPSLGASGAIFGLFGAYLVVSKRLQRDARPLWVLLGINLALGFVLANIDWRAHLGGLAAGAAVAFAFAFAPAGRRLAIQAAGCVAVLVISLGLVTWRSADVANEILRLDVGAADVLSCSVSAPIDPAQTYLTCLQDASR
jgi:membrane associated rhomboid family serine protease